MDYISELIYYGIDTFTLARNKKFLLIYSQTPFYLFDINLNEYTKSIFLSFLQI